MTGFEKMALFAFICNINTVSATTVTHQSTLSGSLFKAAISVLLLVLLLACIALLVGYALEWSSSSTGLLDDVKAPSSDLPDEDNQRSVVRGGFYVVSTIAVGLVLVGVIRAAIKSSDDVQASRDHVEDVANPRPPILLYSVDKHGLEFKLPAGLSTESLPDYLEHNKLIIYDCCHAREHGDQLILQLSPSEKKPFYQYTLAECIEDTINPCPENIAPLKDLRATVQNDLFNITNDTLEASVSSCAPKIVEKVRAYREFLREENVLKQTNSAIVSDPEGIYNIYLPLLKHGRYGSRANEDHIERQREDYQNMSACIHEIDINLYLLVGAFADELVAMQSDTANGIAQSLSKEGLKVYDCCYDSKGTLILQLSRFDDRFSVASCAADRENTCSDTLLALKRERSLLMERLEKWDKEGDGLLFDMARLYKQIWTGKKTEERRDAFFLHANQTNDPFEKVDIPALKLDTSMKTLDERKSRRILQHYRNLSMAVLLQDGEYSE